MYKKFKGNLEGMGRGFGGRFGGERAHVEFKSSCGCVYMTDYLLRVEKQN